MCIPVAAGSRPRFLIPVYSRLYPLDTLRSHHIVRSQAPGPQRASCSPREWSSGRLHLRHCHTSPPARYTQCCEGSSVDDPRSTQPRERRNKPRSGFKLHSTGFYSNGSFTYTRAPTCGRGQHPHPPEAILQQVVSCGHEKDGSHFSSTGCEGRVKAGTFFTMGTERERSTGSSHVPTDRLHTVA